jgi:hypothetical protein
MTVLSQVLLGTAAAGLLWCAACAVFPWMLQLAFREMPAALLAAVSGRSARRRLVRLLRARHAAGREALRARAAHERYEREFAARGLEGYFRVAGPVRARFETRPESRG